MDHAGLHYYHLCGHGDGGGSYDGVYAEIFQLYNGTSLWDTFRHTAWRKTGLGQDPTASDYLPRLGEEAGQFATLLIAVLDYFIRSFDEPTSPEVLSFWSRIADQSGGSGPYYLSGWITAFCFWSAEGDCLYSPPRGQVEIDGFDPRNPGCDLDGTLFHKVNTKDIPDAFVSVPVKIDDNGDIHYTRMVAGSVGIQVSSSGETVEARPVFQRPGNGAEEQKPEDKPGLDTLQPVSGWWMYELVEGSDSKQK